MKQDAYKMQTLASVMVWDKSVANSLDLHVDMFSTYCRGYGLIKKKAWSKSAFLYMSASRFDTVIMLML